MSLAGLLFPHKQTAATKVGFVVSTASARNGSSIPRASMALYLDLYEI